MERNLKLMRFIYKDFNSVGHQTKKIGLTISFMVVMKQRAEGKHPMVLQMVPYVLVTTGYK